MQVQVSTRSDGIVVLAWRYGVVTVPAANARLAAVPASAANETDDGAEPPFRGGPMEKEGEAAELPELPEEELWPDDAGALGGSVSVEEPAFEPPPPWCIVGHDQRVLLGGLSEEEATGVVRQVAMALARPKSGGLLRRAARGMIGVLAVIGAGAAAFMGNAAYEALQPLAVAELAPAGINQDPPEGPGAAVEGAGAASEPPLAEAAPAPVRGGLGEAWLKASNGRSGAGATPFGEGGPVIGGGNVDAGDLQSFGLKP